MFLFTGHEILYPVGASGQCNLDLSLFKGYLGILFSIEDFSQLVRVEKSSPAAV